MSAEIEEKLESMEIQDDEVSAPSDRRESLVPQRPLHIDSSTVLETSWSSRIHIYFFRLASALITITTVLFYLFSFAVFLSRLVIAGL